MNVYNLLSKNANGTVVRKNSELVIELLKLPRRPVSVVPSSEREGEKLVGRLAQYVVHGGEKRKEVKTFPLTTETSVLQVRVACLMRLTNGLE